METDQPVNRIALALDNWRAYEQKAAKYFENLAANRPFQIEKLRFFYKLQSKYGTNRNFEQRLMARSLEHETRKLEKQLFPRFFARMFFRLVVFPLKQRFEMKKEKILLEANEIGLARQVSHTGFPALAELLKRYMERGEQEFTMRQSTFLNEQAQLNHELIFRRDDTGQYNFEGLKTGLVQSGEAPKSVAWKADSGITADDIGNLLSGRACKIGDTWHQVDFNDADSAGNHKVLKLDFVQEFDTEKRLIDLPLYKEQNLPIPLLVQSLEHGNRESILVNVNGRVKEYHAEVDPKKGEIRVFDEKMQRVALSVQQAKSTVSKTHVQSPNQPIKPRINRKRHP